MKILPHSRESEEQVLGALMLDPRRVSDAAVRLAPKDFFVSRHGHVFAALLELHTKGAPIDFVTVGQALKAAGKIVECGGTEELARLGTVVTTSAHLDHNLGTVANAAQLRLAIRTCNNTASAAADVRIDDREELEAFLGDFERDALDIRRQGHDQLRTIPPAEWEATRLRLLSPEDEPRVPTGLADLDALLGGGFRPGQLVVCGARPSAGKSSLGLNIAANAAWHERDRGGRVLLATLEMTRTEVLERLLSAEAGVDTRALGAPNRPSDEELDELVEAQARLAQSGVIIEDAAELTVGSLRARVRQASAEQSLALVVVDYLQLLHADGKRESRQVEIAEVSRGLKALAREARVPVFALAQLNREAEKRQVPRPSLGDFRESGAIEQDADVVLGLWRPDYYPELAKEAEWIQRAGQAELRVLKQRSGPTGSVWLSWDATCTRFGNAGPRPLASFEIT